MPKPENWILIKVHANQKLDIPKTKIPHHKTCGFLSRRLKNLLMDSFAYAFISVINEPYFKVAIGKSDEAFEKRFLNVIKRTFLKELVLEVFRKGGLGYGKKGYLEPFPYSKPYWEYDFVNAKKFDVEGNLKGYLDIKTIYINYSSEKNVSIEELGTTKIKRSKKAPNNAPEILHPLGMLLESPWRHYYKLIEQTKRKNGPKLEVPFEILFILAPWFDQTVEGEILDLLEEYVHLDHSKKYLPIPTKIPKLIERYFPLVDERPESSNWLLENWNKIFNVIVYEAERSVKDLEGFWLWVLGIVDQEKAKKFQNVYYDDQIMMEIDGKNTAIWSSVVPPPHPRNYSAYLKKKEDGENVSPPEIDPDHLDYNLNNHAIDVFSDSVKPITDYI